jgi:hypothetical protein
MSREMAQALVYLPSKGKALISNLCSNSPHPQKTEKKTPK